MLVVVLLHIALECFYDYFLLEFSGCSSRWQPLPISICVLFSLVATLPLGKRKGDTSKFVCWWRHPLSIQTSVNVIIAPHYFTQIFCEVCHNFRLIANYQVLL